MTIIDMLANDNQFFFQVFIENYIVNEISERKSRREKKQYTREIRISMKLKSNNRIVGISYSCGKYLIGSESSHRCSLK